MQTKPIQIYWIWASVEQPKAESALSKQLSNS